MSDVQRFLKMIVETNETVTIYADKREDDWFCILTAPNRDWVEIEVQADGAHTEMVKFLDRLFYEGTNVDLNSPKVPSAVLSAIMLSLLTGV